MAYSNNNIINAFGGILNNLVDGEKYDKLPPTGPPENEPSVSEETLNSLDQDIYGEDLQPLEFDPTNKRTLPVETSFLIKKVEFPSEDQLDGLNVIGIFGDNKRILTTSFHLILSRASIVNFKYTKGFEKPYFYTDSRDSSSLLVLDNNIFDADSNVYTYNELIGETDIRLFDHLSYKNVDNKPFRFKYDHEKSKKAPNSQSLGIAVKFQHGLELVSIEDVGNFFNKDGIMVCLKNGALFSNSSNLQDISSGLQKLLSWKEKNHFFVAVSSQVSESRVLIQTLGEHEHLIQAYFPNQGITVGKIKSFGTDSLLLKKILKPGYRTPLVEYIEKTREGAIREEHLQGLKPLTCYYHKQSKPYSFLRIEIPKFMWEQNEELAEFAISTAIWQYELGGSQPLVLKAAQDRSSLAHEKWVIEQQMKAAFEKKKLGLIEFLNFG